MRGRLIRFMECRGWAIALAACLTAWIQAGEPPPVQFKIPGQTGQDRAAAAGLASEGRSTGSATAAASGKAAGADRDDEPVEEAGHARAAEGSPTPASPVRSAPQGGTAGPTLAPRRNVLRDPKDLETSPEGQLPTEKAPSVRQGTSLRNKTLTPVQAAAPGPAEPFRDDKSRDTLAGENAVAGSDPSVGHGTTSAAGQSGKSGMPSGGAGAGSRPLPVPPASSEAAAPTASGQPVPEPWSGGPTDIEAASFNGITPGASTLAEVEKAWGQPTQTREHNGLVVQQYRVAPFERVEVVYPKGADKVASIVIRLEKSFPAEAVARQLELHKLRGVLVSNELGEILGQAYPERGVLFSFEPAESPGKPTMRVAEIVLEPITADPFLLRAETYLDTRPEESLKDVEQALAMAPASARGHWLRARLLGLKGQLAQALASCEEACRLAPADAQYRLTRAQLLGQLGQFEQAIGEAQKAVEQSGQRQHIKARALCLLGDLYSAGSKPDYKKAVQYHMQAIQVADPLTTSPHPAIRVPAKEALMDAHLGAAHDIAWGKWNQKQTAVPAWLKRASALAEDLIQTEGGTGEHRFRVAARALAACVGAQGQIDPAPWVSQVLEAGQELLAHAAPAYKAQVQWEMGLALYDVVQIYQMRGQRDLALKYGRQAVELLEQAHLQKAPNAPDQYLLGRLYFRLGSLHAIGSGEHHRAVVWFDKAVPLLQQCGAELAESERGRLGETLVSMAVSYWEAGQRPRARQLTQQGMEFMQQAVEAGLMDASALEVPKSNLATMARHGSSEARTAAEQPATLRR